MTIVFYKIYDDRRVVNKTTNNTTKIVELTGIFKQDCDVKAPVVEVAYDVRLMAANYMYISDFGRYYFISPPVLSAQRMIITGEVDVLKSFATDIKKLSCVIARQQDPEYHSNRYLPDPMFRALQPKDILTFNFPQSFDSNGSFVLAVGGHS